MTVKAKKSIPKTNSWWKLGAAVALVIGALGYVGLQYLSVHPGSISNDPPRRDVAHAPQAGSTSGPADDRPMGPPSREEQERMREQMMELLNLTEEQRQQVAKIEKQYGDEDRGAARRQIMEEVLTPEQAEKAHQAMRARMEERMNERLKVLPPDQQAKFREKLEERMAQGRGPGGWGNRGGFPPPPLDE